MILSINMFRAVDALSCAVDLVGVDDVQHGKRVGFMVLQVARALGWDDRRQQDLLFASLLHDCGVSTTDEHGHLVTELEWSNARAHCTRGAGLLADVPLLAHLAPVVLFHHTRWNSSTLQCQHATLAQGANLIFLADRLDALRAGKDPATAFETKHDVLKVLRRYAGTLFMPELVAVMDRCAQSEAFWFSQSPELLEFHLHEMMAHQGGRPISHDDLKSLAIMFARIIDAKSPFTAQHSEKVAHLATAIAAGMGEDEDTVRMVEIAGYLHDLGKLRVPDEILDKPAPLSAHERLIMKRHAFDTYEVLFRLFGDGPIARWAAFHHETLNGEGYPFQMSAPALPLPARIIAVSDIFQALVQERPYRASMLPQDLMPIMEDMAANGRIDADVLGHIRADLPRYWLLAGGDARRLAPAATPPAATIAI